jgi:hypothetical protein
MLGQAGGNNINMKVAIVCVDAPCSLVEAYRRFRGACCLHHQGDRLGTSVSLYQSALSINPEDSHFHPEFMFIPCTRDQVSHSYEMTDVIIVLCLMIFMLMDRENERF